MPRVKYSLKARNDILAIYEYIAASGEQYADAFLDRLEARCKLLESAPNSGRRRPDFRPEIRSFPLRPSVVFYRVEDLGGHPKCTTRGQLKMYQGSVATVKVYHR